MANKEKAPKIKKDVVKRTKEEAIQNQPDDGSEKVLYLNIGDTLVISTRFQVPEEALDMSRLLDDGAFICTGDGPDIPAKRYHIIRSGTYAIRSKDGSKMIRIVIDRPINAECMVVV